jgi:hypothetical protein
MDDDLTSAVFQGRFEDASFFNSHCINTIVAALSRLARQRYHSGGLRSDANNRAEFPRDTRAKQKRNAAGVMLGSSRLVSVNR